MAAMVGFCLTGDLFNLIVFFELMSAAAFALTAYRIEERAPIQGAINFAITNSIAGYAMFIGVALLYARTGALNMAQIGARARRPPRRPAGDRRDGAAVPRLPDQGRGRATALLARRRPRRRAGPGLRAVLRRDGRARRSTPSRGCTGSCSPEPLGPHADALRAILVALGVMHRAARSAGCASLQRHIKRLLAFSTISHVGLFVCGVGLLELEGARRGGRVRRRPRSARRPRCSCARGCCCTGSRRSTSSTCTARGARCRFVGVLFAVGAVLLAAAPPFTAFAGKSLIESASSEAGYGWLIACSSSSRPLTGGAVLRVAGRVFLGWGPSRGPRPKPGPGRHERVDETRDATRLTRRPLMIVVPAVLLVAAAVIVLRPGGGPGCRAHRRAVHRPRRATPSGCSAARHVPLARR